MRISNNFALFGGSLYDSKFDEVLYKDFVFEASLLPANTERFRKCYDEFGAKK